MVYEKKELKVYTTSLCGTRQAIILVIRIQIHKQITFLKSLKMQVLHNLYTDGVYVNNAIISVHIYIHLNTFS